MSKVDMESRNAIFFFCQSVFPKDPKATNLLHQTLMSRKNEVIRLLQAIAIEDSNTGRA